MEDILNYPTGASFSTQLISVLLIVALSFLGGLSCSKYTKAYKQEVRPKVKLLFEIYFGVDNDGIFLVQANEEADGQRRGLQDIVASKMDDFNMDEKRRLIKANQRMVKLLGKAKSVDDKLQRFGASSGRVLEAIQDILKVAGEVYIESRV